MWDFRRNIAHNNKCSGIFVWQNTSDSHVVEDFICYHNGIAGINHGAYLTAYVYRNGYLFKNGSSAIDLSANAFTDTKPLEPSVQQRFEAMYCVAGPNNEFRGSCQEAHAVTWSSHAVRRVHLHGPGCCGDRDVVRRTGWSDDAGMVRHRAL